jgi:hypothetical protein
MMQEYSSLHPSSASSCRPWLYILVCVCVCILVAFISAYLAATYVQNQYQKVIRNTKNTLKEQIQYSLVHECDVAKYFSYNPSLRSSYTNFILEQNDYFLSCWLIPLCENVSNYNCFNDPFYQKKKQQKSALLPLPKGFTNIEPLELTARKGDKSTYGYLMYDSFQRVTYLIWSGTATPWMWLYDSLLLERKLSDEMIQAWPEEKQDEIEKVRIHEGFLKIYKQLRSFIIEQWNSVYSTKSDYFIICGHSLGGALTHLSAFDLIGTSTVGVGARAGAGAREGGMMKEDTKRDRDEKIPFGCCGATSGGTLMQLQFADSSQEKEVKTNEVKPKEEDSIDSILPAPITPTAPTAPAPMTPTSSAPTAPMTPTAPRMVAFSFGAPRCGNNAFANIYDQDETFKTKLYSRRVFNTEDVIPYTPLATSLTMPRFTYQYTHVGNPYPFTLNLGSVTSNHISAYEEYFRLLSDK